MSDNQIEIIVRGVCVHNGSVLLCRTKGHTNTYLPGGHVEFNEGAREALQREILEELGVSAEAGGFLGVIEHVFEQRGKKHCEVNLVFEMICADLDSSVVPEAKEEYIEFSWIKLDVLSEARVEPSSIIHCLAEWLSAKHDNLISNY